MEKKARIIEFDTKGINVVLGDSRAGKTTFIRSLFYSIGCKTAQVKKEWKNAEVKSILYLSVNNDSYKIVRDGSFFGIFDRNDNLLKAFSEVYLSDDSLSAYICNILDYKLKLISYDSGREEHVNVQNIFYFTRSI